MLFDTLTFAAQLKKVVDKIPIAFTYEGKGYKGVFNKVSGSGSTANFHLMIADFYQGQISNTENHGWKFYSNTGKFEILSGYFGEYITAYLQ